MNAPSTDVIRRVYAEHGEAFIEVGPWPDSPDDCLELRTAPGAHSAEYFGPVNISIAPAMAAELGRALIAAAEEYL